MCLVPTHLAHCIYPVGIVIPVVVFCPALVVVQLVDVGGSRRILCRVIQLLLHQHGVFITGKQIVTIWLPGALEHEVIVDADLSALTALGLDTDDTVGTTCTPDGGSGSILQDVDALDIVHVDGKQRAVGLLRSG